MYEVKWNLGNLWKFAMFWKVGVEKLGFESGKGFDLLNCENSKRRAGVQECGMVFLHNVRGVHF